MSRRSYTELPVVDERGEYRSAWAEFPAGDELGCLGTITPQVRLAALAEAVDGVTVNLTLPVTEPDPPMSDRGPLRHTIFARHRNALDDRLDGFFTQGSTQWDGFRHIRARDLGFFTGVTDGFAAGDFEGDRRLGIDAWARAGILGRGVLLDVSAKHRAMVEAGVDDEDCVIEVDDLERAASDAGVEVRPGDVLCVRTGWLEHHRSLDAERREYLDKARRWPGLSGSAAMAERLWDWGVAALTADNPAVENGPGRVADGSLHRRLIPLLGLPLGELFDLEDLTRECRRRGRYSFLFVAVPLHLPGGVGSPGNAVAVL